MSAAHCGSAQTRNTSSQVPVDIMDGIAEEEALSMATEMGFDGTQAKAAGVLVEKRFQQTLVCTRVGCRL